MYATARATLVLMAAVWSVACPAGEPLPGSVLILNQAPSSVPWFYEVGSSIRRTIRSGSADKVSIHEEHLDLGGEFSGDQYNQLLRQFIREKYRDKTMGLIVPIGATALELAIQLRRDVPAFAQASIVFAVVRDVPAQHLKNEPRLTGLTSHSSFRLQMAIAEALVPSLKHLALVGDPFDRNPPRRHFAAEIAEISRTVEIIDLMGKPMQEVRDRASRLPDQTAIAYLGIYVDGTGTRYVPRDALRLVAETANRPIVVDAETHFGHGATGGFIISTEATGRQVGELALRVLGGEDAHTIPIAPSKGGKLTFDWRELQRWGIDPTRLPPGSDIRFRQATAWELYRWQITAGIAVIVLQALLITGLILQRTRRHFAEEALRASYGRVRQLAGRLIAAQEEERTRIARELHDDVGQRVASLSIGLSGLRRRVAGSDGSVGEDVSVLQQQTMSLGKDLRTLSHELHPGALEHLGLIEALRARCDEVKTQSGVDVSLDVGADWPDVVTDGVALCLYRVAQEALRNIVKHAQATRACISLDRQGAQVVMRVSDDGRGFDAGRSVEHGGLGLLSMRERVEMLGGKFEVTSSPDAGTVTMVTVAV